MGVGLVGGVAGGVVGVGGEAAAFGQGEQRVGAVGGGGFSQAGLAGVVEDLVCLAEDGLAQPGHQLWWQGGVEGAHAFVVGAEVGAAPAVQAGGACRVVFG